MRILSAKFQIVNERIAFFKYVDTYGTTLTQGEGTEVPIIKTILIVVDLLRIYLPFLSPCYIGFLTRLVSFVKKVIFRMIWHKVSINHLPCQRLPSIGDTENKSENEN